MILVEHEPFEISIGLCWMLFMKIWFHNPPCGRGYSPIFFQPHQPAEPWRTPFHSASNQGEALIQNRSFASQAFYKDHHHSRNTSPQLNSFLSFNAHLDIINSFSAVCRLRQLRTRILPKRIPYFDFFALSSFLSFLYFVLSTLSLPPLQLHFPRLPELILPAGKPSHRLSWFSHWHRSRQIRRVQEVWCRLKTEEQEVWQWKRKDCLKVEQTWPEDPWIK